MTHELLELLDWKRRMFAVYAEVRAADDPLDAWRRWRFVRDELFRAHPQSPLPPDAREDFTEIDYFPYDPEARVLAEVEPVVRIPLEIAGSAESVVRFERFAVARFDVHGAAAELELYWLEGYGGGVFLPFADATSGEETYGAGRYLLDTVKGADLGTAAGDLLVLDFNFAYNPSCAYDARWACPLTPPPNRLPFAVRAGERYLSSSFSAAELMQ